jgi:hypothetical protein
VLLFTNADLRAVKWHDWKLHYTYTPEAGAPPVAPFMRLFNLRSDPKEETDIKDANPWAQGVMDKIVADFTATTVRYPPRAAERARSVRTAEAPVKAVTVEREALAEVAAPPQTSRSAEASRSIEVESALSSCGRPFASSSAVHRARRRGRLRSRVSLAIRASSR